MISNQKLIERAVQASHPFKTKGEQWIGDVGAALITSNGNVYVGTCVDSGSGLGFCAERSAISQMFANGETEVKKIVAVWNNNPAKDLYILPPCGACREFMKQVCENGIDIEVVLGRDTEESLGNLLPYSEWPEKAD